MVRELSAEEQIRMSIKEAGKLYDGNFILFTNYEEVGGTEYGVPRLLSLNSQELYFSGLTKKYRQANLYGVTLDCSDFLAEDQLPPPFLWM